MKNKKIITVFATVLMLSSIAVSVSAASSSPVATAVPANNAKAISTTSNFVDDLNKEPVIVESANNAKVIEVTNVTVPTSTEPTQILKGQSSVARSSNVPNSYWNLAAGSYPGSFDYVQDYVFTNYYFSTNAEKSIFISVSTQSETLQQGSFRIVAYETGSNNAVATYYGTVGITANAKFYNLSANKTYYFGVLNDMSSPIEGSLTVYH